MSEERGNSNVLRGLGSIAAYAGLSRNAVLSYIATRGFPARQLEKGGMWRATREAVDAWWTRQLDLGMGSK